ncbi:MAG: LLM class flavin-dependent oxidoreductase [Pseudorhodoplanes sp.]
MKFGNIFFSYNLDPRRDDVFISEILREAQLCDELGMDSVWMVEHHFSCICPYADPVGLASAIAATTRKVKIGFAVLQASFHHPVKLAEQISLLDNISRGRMIIGLGRGNLGALYEYDAYNVDEGEAQERLIETEKLLVSLWTGQCGYSGKFWDFKIPQLRPAPFTRPHPVLLRSAYQDASFVELAKRNRPVLAGFTFESDFLRKLELYADTMRQAGRSEDEVRANLDQSWTMRRIFVAETDEEAQRIGLPAFRAVHSDRREESVRFHAAVGREAPSWPVGEEGFICGSPDRVIKSIATMQAAGLGGVIFSFRLGAMPADVAEKSLRLFMKEVAPAFQTRKPAVAAE